MDIDISAVLVEGIKLVAAGFTATATFFAGRKRGRREGVADPGVATEILSVDHRVDRLSDQVMRNTNDIAETKGRVDDLEDSTAEDRGDIKLMLEIVRSLREDRR